MTSTVSPHDMANIIPTPMSTSHPTRRTSRSSTSQSGCRTSRIEKPKSNHNSPRTVERRKTTTGTKLYATLDDHLNMMFGITGEEEVIAEQQQRARPVSWHPSSKQFHVSSQQSSVPAGQGQAQEWSRYHSASSRNSAVGSDFYSLSSRNSMHPEQMQNMSKHTSYEAHRGSQESDSSWQEVQQTPSYALSTFSTPATEPMPWYLQEWTRKNHAHVMNSQHGSNDFLPIQHPSAEQDMRSADEDEEMEDSGKELVGMGLYDLPEPSLSWSSGLVEATGKGLKLEETWQPPEEDDNDDEDGEGDDDGSSEASVEEPPPPPPATHGTEQLKMPVKISPQTPGSMEGQSFFFDEDESLAKEWWFQQLKQPSMPVRDAGIGHGWL